MDEKLRHMMRKTLNDDLASLSTLDEQTVLDELKNRFLQNQIYTYIGDILIAMNPLKMLPIYDKMISNLYKTCDELSKLKPHVYATAELCYRQMIRTQQSQCILISGESGSGKTETCRYLVEHLLNRTKQFEVSLNSKIEQVNPILEAFGNAKTRINDNSSRFGKYLEIYFEEDGTVVGAKFKEYLLEKSRIVYQNENESTFHIFYLLIAGLTSKEKYKYGLLNKNLQNTNTNANNNNSYQHRYILNTIDYRMNNYLTDENRNKFNSIIDSMKTIGFSEEDIENVIHVLVSILYIGDIKFVNEKNGSDAVRVENFEIIKHVCELLEIDVNELNDALISDEQITRGEQIRRERNMIQACDIRDAFAKALYGRLFSWIVNQINHHIQPAQGIVPNYSIGLLDIFGFENFQKNSFEQMCINLANEQLHQLFTKYIFKLEIQDSLDEEISFSDGDLISYQDNQVILDLFLEKRNSIFTALDEISRFPQATDQSLATKLHQTLPNVYTDVYIPPKNGGVSFQIVHYAGQVLYNVEGFLEKNRDFLPNNLIHAARNSDNLLLQELFRCKLTRQGTIAPSDRQSKVRKSIRSFAVGYKPSLIKKSVHSSSDDSSSSQQSNFNGTSTTNSRNSSFVVSSTSNITVSSDKALPLTVACHFKNSLQELIGKINTCKAYFIRCIKPNPKQENVFVDSFVIKQLRYCSIMHVCKIRKCGYPYRVNFQEFLRWYKPIEICTLKKSNPLTQIQRCVFVLNHSKIHNNYKIGKTKLFLRYWHIDMLNQISKKYLNQVIVTQKVVRGWLARNRILKMQQEKAKQFFMYISDTSFNVTKKINAIPALTQNDFKAMINKAAKIQQNNKKTEPDLKEIDQTLELFDEMLNDFEIYDNNNNNIEFHQQKPLNNAANVNRSSSFQLSPSAVYSIVHNNNNKYDNTLKKRNALVAFEFRNLVSKYNHGIYEPNTDSIGNSSSSSGTGTNSTCSSNEGVNESSSHATAVPINLKTNNNLLSTSLTNLNNSNNKNMNVNHHHQHHQHIYQQNDSSSKFQQNKYNNKSNLDRKLSNIDTNKQTSHFPTTVTIQHQHQQSSNPNLTIWREELITKSNFEEKVKKENELTRKIEDSKKLIPEWKKNLLKQKEMKKAAANNSSVQQQQPISSVYNNYNHNNNNNNGLQLNGSSKSEPETPELMKHNMFIKKGLATHL